MTTQCNIKCKLSSQIGHLETKINNLTKLHKLAQNLQEAQESEIKKEKNSSILKLSALESTVSKLQEERKKVVSIINLNPFYLLN